jgi:hypothetical protein
MAAGQEAEAVRRRGFVVRYVPVLFILAILPTTYMTWAASTVSEFVTPVAH